MRFRCELEQGLPTSRIDRSVAARKGETMTDSPTPPHEMDELDMPERPSGVRRKRPAAERSPTFNKLPRLQKRVTREEAVEFRKVVKQPPVLEAFVKPLKPVSVKR